VTARPCFGRKIDGVDEEHGSLSELLASAIAAEQETGRREVTGAAAGRHLVVRVVRVAAGVVIVCFGLSLIVLPGPGLIVTAAGLALMASDVPFARRWLHAVRRRLPEGEDGTIESWVIVGSCLMFVASLGASIWWTFLR
jgi:hypothetical protein